MVIEKFWSEVEAVGSETGEETYAVKRVWGDGGKKSLVVELYPTLPVNKCSNMDLSGMHLWNHTSDFGWSEMTIVNLYSRIYDKKPTVNDLKDEDLNIAYIEELLETPEMKDTQIILAWGNSLDTNAKTNIAKNDLLKILKRLHLEENVFCITTDTMQGDETTTAHPLYLGLRHSRETWKLKPVNIDNLIKDLESKTKLVKKVTKKRGKNKKDVLQIEE